MLNFKNWLEQNTVGKHNDFATGAYASSSVTGSETFGPKPNHLTSQDLVIQGVPSKTVEGKIAMVDLNRDPVYVQLYDGTQLYIPHDAVIKRVQGEIKKGKTLRVTFQRHANDNSEEPSKIAWAQVY